MASRTDRPLTGHLPPCLHGSTYRRGCRCAPCRARGSIYRQRHYRIRNEAQWGIEHDTDRLPAESAAKIVRHIKQKLGVPLAEMERVTGVSEAQLRKLNAGLLTYVSRGTYNKIAKHYSTEDRVPRVRAQHSNAAVPREEWDWLWKGLLAQGWDRRSLRELLEGDGRSAEFLTNMARKTGMVRSSYENLVWLVKTVGDKRGPSTRNANWMLREGHYPLIHYTEDGKLLVNSITAEQAKLRSRLLREHELNKGRPRRPSAKERAGVR